MPCDASLKAPRTEQHTEQRTEQHTERHTEQHTEQHSAQHTEQHSAQVVEDSFRSDGSPKYCTVWVALSDATPENSCLTVLPKYVDSGYETCNDLSKSLPAMFSDLDTFQVSPALHLLLSTLVLCLT